MKTLSSASQKFNATGAARNSELGGGWLLPPELDEAGPE
jgi:hypothetical protein